MSTMDKVDLERVEKLRAAHARLKQEIGKIIIGQHQVLDQLLMAIFCRSHALLMGVPGLAKTLMVSTLAQALDLTFKRIQFTPDLMPSDITGTEILQDDPKTGERKFKFLRGPVFANIILADEINRTPPKTQAALLESMQEKKVSIGGEDHPLEEPFFVLATQNPIEQEGTYPLPEAQLDRFFFNILVKYPSWDEEIEIMKRVTGCAPKMWGPSIVGFDSYHYRYDSGHEGDCCVVGFASRKADLTIYLLSGYEDAQTKALLSQLGKHKIGKACLYVKRLADVQLPILEELIKRSVAETRRRYPKQPGQAKRPKRRRDA